MMADPPPSPTYDILRESAVIKMLLFNSLITQYNMHIAAKQIFYNDNSIV